MFQNLVKLILVFIVIYPIKTIAMPVSLGDLNKVKERLSTPFSVQSGNKIFFSRNTAALGHEVWVTDGTVAGTSLLKDIAPGADSSNPMSFQPATFGGVPGVYFVAGDPVNGIELWKSDGTAAGTILVKDINPGTGAGVRATGSIGIPLIATISTASLAFFAGNDGANGTEIWISDGTAAGTNMITDIEAGAGSSNPSNIKFFPGIVLFTAQTAASGREPYQTNGLASAMIDDIAAGASSSDPTGFHVSTNGGKVVFGADNLVNGRELWQTNLITTSLVSDITPGADSSTLHNFISAPTGDVLFNNLIIPNTFPFAPGAIDSKLYTTDGTPGGTTLLADLPCIPGGFFSLIAPGVLQSSRIVNNHVVFPCADKDSVLFGIGDSEPWVTDGTAASTRELKDIFPGPGSSDVVGFYPGNNRLLFGANDGVRGNEVWTTDGTTFGTMLLQDFNPGEASSMDLELATLALINNAEQTASLLPLTINEEQKIYYSDGTLANTRELFDDSGTGTSGSDPRDFIGLGKLVLFAATHTKKGNELFFLKRKRPKILKNIFKAGGSNPRDLTKLNKKTVLFTATNVNRGNELWKTNGKRKGTRLVKDIFNGAPSSNIVIFDAKFKRKLFMSANDGANGDELWITNGKPKGTKLVSDINPGSDSSFVSNLVVMNKKAYFSADNGTNGFELWVSDGKPAGTMLLADIVPGANSSLPNRLTVLNNRIIFVAETAATGEELFVSDGTAAGTMLLKDINPGAGDSFPSNFTVSGNNLFFAANDGANGFELWRTDGTAAGTFLVEDINLGVASANVSEIAAFPGDRVIFRADNGTLGSELWIAGPTAGSANLLKDIENGATGSFPFSLFRIPKKPFIYFSAETTTNGRELWRTDGTIAGTVLVADIEAGADGSAPEDFFFQRRKLYFTAATEAKGREPYFIKAP